MPTRNTSPIETISHSSVMCEASFTKTCLVESEEELCRIELTGA